MTASTLQRLAHDAVRERDARAEAEQAEAARVAEAERQEEIQARLELLLANAPWLVAAVVDDSPTRCEHRPAHDGAADRVIARLWYDGAEGEYYLAWDRAMVLLGDAHRGARPVYSLADVGDWFEERAAAEE